MSNANGGTMPDDRVLSWELENGIGWHNPQFVAMWHSTHARLTAHVGQFQSLCDLGAGTGIWASVAKTCGTPTVVAIDRNPHHREYHKQHGNPDVEYHLFDFVQHGVGDAHFDVISSIEVFEHIPDDVLAPFADTLAHHCTWFLFSSTPHHAPTDELWGHVNIKSMEDWQRFFEARGFRFVCNMDHPTPWAMLFKSEILI